MKPKQMVQLINQCNQIIKNQSKKAIDDAARAKSD